MKNRTMLLCAAAALAAIAGLAWAFAPRPVDVEIAVAVVAPFEETIDEDGKTRLVDRYVVSAPLAGRLARIEVREGDAVAAGAIVARLSPVLPPMLDERSTREAAARVESAQAQSARAAVRIERARVAVDQAHLEWRRSEQLARDGFIAAAKLESDGLAARAAARELDTAVQERHIAEHELEQARAAVAALRPAALQAGKPFEVRAPVGGQVMRVLQASEATVPLAAALLEIGNLDGLEVVADLLTPDALRAVPGTPVRIERWGGDGMLEGRVRRVEPSAFTKISALGVEEQRVKVVIELTSPRAAWRGLGDGFRVAARIVVRAEGAALQVPASAVFPLPDSDGHAAAAFVVADGRARLTPVALVARNGTTAWIGPGLEPGTKVIVYPPAAVRNGVRVRERRV